MGTYLTLDKINSYNVSFDLSNHVWDVVNKWDWFSKKAVGVQYVTAIDSISALIAEGFGRYTKKDKIRFYRMSNGSVFESLDWTEKALKRKLITPQEYREILSVLTALPKEVNHLIKFTNERLSE